MKVKELLDELKDLDPNSEAVFSYDEEGSCFSEIEKVTIGVYEDEDGFNEEDLTGKGKRAICLWPPV